MGASLKPFGLPSVPIQPHAGWFVFNQIDVQAPPPRLTTSSVSQALSFFGMRDTTRVVYKAISKAFPVGARDRRIWLSPLPTSKAAAHRCLVASAAADIVGAASTAVTITTSPLAIQAQHGTCHKEISSGSTRHHPG